MNGEHSERVGVAKIRVVVVDDSALIRSVLKKLKSPAFAAAVDRDDIRRGAQELELELEQHIQNVIDALSARRVELELTAT